MPIVTISFTGTSILLFALCLWANSGPLDDGACDVYCGPTNLLVASAFIVLFPISWLAAVATIVASLVDKHRLIALICGLVLLIPVVTLIVMFIASHA